ncbi:CTP synthase [Chaetoceros tenuissimus]|uniref:CTP synthase n=1 Tax=Chaetoceros tenuissimus TaxID=426638 RepID=A0AAD3D8H9_9STRA|nr:CTP synthase [Chaetoceros tenuissimus]
MKYVIVSGGVVSGLGKGVTISSLGRMLRGCGLRVTSIKIDPYLNVDAGTMSPFEHGEVFVLGDGGESDLDLGNYERFLDIQLTSEHNITTGKIYREVISRERRGDYLGKTVQVVPHITNEIQDWIERVAKVPVDDSGEEADVCLIEVGGTVGDIESSIFFEALRQFQFRVGYENFCLMFVSLVPILSDEQKTKPTQHGVKSLMSLGLSPKVIFCRCPLPLEQACKNKISAFCHVPSDNVISVHDVNNVYHVPLLLMQQNLHRIIAKELNLEAKMQIENPDMKKWSDMAHSVDGFTESVKIALIGKYNGLQDAYLSIIKSLKHASIACERKLDLVWVEASQLESSDNEEYESNWEKIKTADGVIVPGGFGTRGFNGKCIAAEYCRKNKKPYLGICLGFQAMVVEYARNVIGWDDANSAEFDESTAHPVIVFMPEIDKETMGGNMRLGARNTKFTHKHDDGSMATAQIMYDCAEIVSERHRHRYEVNPEVVDTVHDAGLKFVGRDETGERMEVAELPRSQHPYYVGCQYHPEFKSRPLRPSPPFYGLLLASIGKLDEFIAENHA